MSSLSKITSLFTSHKEEVVFDYSIQSCLSNPKVQFLYPQHIRILRELAGIPQGITANKFNKISQENSADKRVNELYHLGYLNAEKHDSYFLYFINEKWLKIIWNQN